jgi:hypothetical protein
MDIRHIILEEIKSFNTYYRAVGSYGGDEVEFNPEGYYEGIDDNDQPKYKYDTFWISNVGETAASKYIGGAVLGASSMFRTESKLKPQTKLYIYAINEKPDKDISHWNLQDFEYLQEVRYRRPVKGIYVGSVVIGEEMVNTFNLLYEVITAAEQEYDEDSEEYNRMVDFYQNMLETGKFQEYLNNIRVS